ncbi:MAG: hypothetical protein FWC97_07470 [Treponema sp.]|nr:hypothetical protein [Treponema sp.]
MRRLILTCLLFTISALAMSQEQAAQTERINRGSIPEALIRPARGESPRFPVDTVIGELGQGRATAAAFAFANSILEGLLSLDMNHSSLAAINPNLREGFLSSLGAIEPLSYRIGGGREEPDGSISFLVRFIGIEYGISGELYIRFRTRQSDDGEGPVTAGTWVFEDLLLDEARTREVEQRESIYRHDFNPFERFF